jgi:hypothetical protein
MKANIQFALSYFLLFDAATLSSHAKPPSDAPHDVVPVHMSFVDWVPAICSTRTSSPPYVPSSFLFTIYHIQSLYSVILRLNLRSQGIPFGSSRSAQRIHSFALLPSVEELTTSRIPSSFPSR